MSRYKGLLNCAVQRLSTIGCLLFVSLFLSACVPTMETQDGRRIRATSDEFQEYAAAVFRRQNAASVALVEMLDRVEAADPPLARRIEDVDTKLQSACDTLNAVASARRDGRDLAHSTLRALVDDIPVCDAATEQAETLLAALSPNA